jgi:hypothetical protein
MTTYTYTISPCNLEQLDGEIKNSNITVALSSITMLGDQVSITFKASLSSTEEDELTSITANHIATPSIEPEKPVQVTALPDPGGFRYRGNATPWTVCEPGETNLDLTMAEELHIDGGTIIVKDANPGDYCVFQVVHPIAGVVEQFVNKSFVIPGTGKMDVNVYRARIPAGLIIRVVYHNTGSTNVECGINLRLHLRI